MGNLLSTTATAAGAMPPATEDKPEGLFLSEIEAEAAPWSREGRCVTFQRYLGWLPDSKAEELKKLQKYARYAPRMATDAKYRNDSEAHKAAGEKIASALHRYYILTKWRTAVAPILKTVQEQLAELQVLELEAAMIKNFRQALTVGFTANKVSIDGTLKSVRLRLKTTESTKGSQPDCYLTWEPSRKRQPRIDLHDIKAVVPVNETNNEYAPRLARKVSPHLGFIIVCKSHHRGRVVLEVGSEEERYMLLEGFKRLLHEITITEPMLDEEGALRKREPRRQSVIRFLDLNRDQQGSKADSSAVSSRLSDSTSYLVPSQGDLTPDVGDIVERGNNSEYESQTPEAQSEETSKEQFYQTRFDEEPATKKRGSWQTKSKRSLRSAKKGSLRPDNNTTSSVK